jgi:uncharacterized protein
MKMISILSPAKTLDMSISKITGLYSEPLFNNEAAQLMAELKKYSPPELETLMKINSELAERNFSRNSFWKKEHDPSNSKQAAFAYAGTVYQGLDAATLDEGSLLFAQDHLRILSGLYGVLRPLDLIHPYRLEMGIKLKNPNGKDLYVFWKDRITAYLSAELEKQDQKTLVNLASHEYSSVIERKALNARIVTPVFRDYMHGSYKVVMVYTKRARGMMARYIMENRIDNPEHLRDYNQDGYMFSESLSSPDEFIFLRQAL